MKSNQNKIIETAPANPAQPDPQLSTIPDLTDLFCSFIILFGLLISIKKLWRSLDKLRKQRKCSPKLLFSIVSALVAIWKAIAQIDDELDRDNEE
jgi:hypothetical protein